MKLISTAIAATMIAGGVAKLNRFPAYEQLVDGLDWTEEERQRIGVAEIVGGALLLFGPTRRLGAGVVLAASGAALASELRGDQTELVSARGGVILGALLVAMTG
jgi:uncharacterized membrane protein YphA (DoxX/SURF4 family)